MFGAGILNARYVRAIAAALETGNVTEAGRIDTTMCNFLYGIYGGTRITCWLTGLKEALVRLGIFSTNTNFLRCKRTSKATIDGGNQEERFFRRFSSGGARVPRPWR